MKLLPQMKNLMKSNGYILYSRPFELNIVGIRSENTNSGKFDDEIHVFYKTNAIQWNYHVFKATTDPSTYWLKHPMNVSGTAILMNGQYINAYALGLHKGQYKALVQVKPIDIIRDYDRNAILDFNNGTKHRGLYGVNIHRASAHGTTKSIDKWSAGCQVFENATAFNDFIKLCDIHRKYYGNHFTYTLIDKRAIKRRLYKKLSIGLGLGLGFISLGVISYFYYNHLQHD